MSLLPAPPSVHHLGASRLTISALGWGMWRMVRTGSRSTETARLVHAAVDAGISLLDTADIYGFDGKEGFGAAESLLGDVLRAEPGLRARITLSTKGGIRPPLPYDQSKKWLDEAIDASLRRLNVETIDLWHVHRPDILTHPQELARTLDAAVSAGKIRELAVSNFTTHQIAALDRFLDHKLVATQPEISPLRLACFENGELDQAMTMGLRPLAWSPLGGGRLFNPSSSREKAVVDALDAFAADKGITRAAAAYSWLLAHPAGIVPIIGSQNSERITEAASALHVRWARQEWYAVMVASRGERLP